MPPTAKKKKEPSSTKTERERKRPKQKSEPKPKPEPPPRQRPRAVNDEVPLRTLADKLRFLNCDAEELRKKETVVEQFAYIKKRFYAEALKKHPDKLGGSEEAMKLLGNVWEDVRSGYETKKYRSFDVSDTSFPDAEQQRAGKKSATHAQTRKKKPTTKKASANKNGDDDEAFEQPKEYNYKYKSYSYYEEAANYNGPYYRVELARSNRSKCCAKRGGVACEHENDIIDLNEIRVGHINPTSGGFGSWSHLRCWRIPTKIWNGLPQSDNGPLDKKAKQKKAATKAKPTKKGRGGKQSSMDRRVVIVEDDDEEEDKFEVPSEEVIKEFSDAISTMNDVLEGLDSLNEKDKRTFAIHCANRENWAIARDQNTREPGGENDLGFALANGDGDDGAANKKSKGMWGMTHVSEPTLVPGVAEFRAAKEAKKENVLPPPVAMITSTTTTENKRGLKRKQPPPPPITTTTGVEIITIPSDDDDSESDLQPDASEQGLQIELLPPNQLAQLKPGDSQVVASSQALHNKNFVLTGTFPEVGGGVGLKVGKDNARALIERFGGKVVGSISGKTTHLVIGHEPGASKVEAAQKRNMKRTTIKEIQQVIFSGDTKQLGQEGVIIEAFSGGFYGNGTARDKTDAELQRLGFDAADPFSPPRQIAPPPPRRHPAKKKAKKTLLLLGR